VSSKEYKRCSHHRSHEVSAAGCSSLRPHVKVSGIRLFAQTEHGIPGAGLGLTAAVSTVLHVLGWLRRGQGDDVPQRIGALHQLYLLFHPLTVVRSHEDGAHPRPHEERNLVAHQKQKQKQKRISTLLLAKIALFSCQRGHTKNENAPPYLIQHMLQGDRCERRLPRILPASRIGVAVAVHTGYVVRGVVAVFFKVHISRHSRDAVPSAQVNLYRTLLNQRRRMQRKRRVVTATQEVDALKRFSSRKEWIIFATRDR
jgi:hypothetical protein